MKNTIKTDNRTIQQVAKAVATMRRRVAAAVRRHEKLQQRIHKLQAEGRIVNLSHYSDILAGIDCWYVKSDSLNPNPDALSNWYYETTWNAEAGYGCGCEKLNGTCQHITKLAATFAPVQPSAAERAEAQAAKEHLQADLVLYQAEQYTREIAPLNTSNQGFHLLRV